MNAPSITTSDLCGQFLHHLAAQPDAPAVVSRDGVISFQSMGRMVAAAQQIITAAKPRTVGLYFAPSPALVAAAWGALFSGVAYVPLAPTYPEDRIRYMLRAGDVDLILTPAELRGDLEEIVAGPTSPSPRFLLSPTFLLPVGATHPAIPLRPTLSPSCSTPLVPPELPREWRFRRRRWLIK